MSGHGLGMQRQEGARGKVDDPKVVDTRRFKSLGRPRNVLAQKITAPMGVEIILLQPAIDRRQSRQSGISLLPLPVEQFDRHSRKATHLFQDPLLLLGGQAPGFAPVRPGFGLKPLEYSRAEDGMASALSRLLNEPHK